MVDSQEWLNKNYSQKKTKQITKLNLSKKKLLWILDLSDFTNLEKLNCGKNHLTRIILPQPNKLRKLNFSNNHLTSFDYAQLNPQICTNLNLSYNKLEPTDLAVFSPLVNLTNLDISDNKFFGSLEFLQNCTRLKYLDISNTNINQGLEYLPESLETFLYSSSADSNFQVQIIEKEINNQGNDWKTYRRNLISEWKKQGLSAQEFQEWRGAGLALNDYLFAYYLKQDGYQPQQVNKDNLQELRKKTAWQDIHPYFDINFQIRAEWEKERFNYQSTKEWISVGLNQNEFVFAKYLRDKGCQPSKRMVQQESWKNIYPEFTYSLRKDWENQGLGYQETQGWIKVGFNPNQLELIKNWKDRSFDYQEVKEWKSIGFNLDNYEEANGWKEIGIKESQEWILIGFGKKNHQLAKEWKNKGFDYQETQRWLGAGANSNDYEFIAWLRYIKQETSSWIINYQADYQLLSERFKKYGLCQECQQLNTGEKWCQICNAQRLQANFANWTSGNFQIDQFIQKCQSEATEANKFLEWIPYQQFTQVEYLAEGGFGKVYQAHWTEGNIHHWDKENNRWIREKDYYYEKKDKKQWDFEWNKNWYKKHRNYRETILKIVFNSQDSIDFLDETIKHKTIDDWFNSIVPCYGLSQDPETGNYLMVMQYLPERDLRHYLRKNQQELKEKLFQRKKLEQEWIEEEYINKLDSEIANFQTNKINQLANIARGLKDIHQKNLMHRDFHAGNILKGLEQTECLITDLGLCKPADQISQEEKIFGVLPYVAPEVLQSQPYTQASDIYSFGIVAYELLTGLPPYYDRSHDVQLGVAICQGLRPQFSIEIPELLEDLIKQCWANEPQQRPAASELAKKIRNWWLEVSSNRETEFRKQLRKSEEYNLNLPLEVRFPNYQIHYGAIYHSKLLPTKEITQLMRGINFQTKACELKEQLTQVSKISSVSNSYESEKQKRTALKEALKSLLEKSQNLSKEIAKITADKSLISEETSELLKKLKTKLDNLQNKDNEHQELETKKAQREEELNNLKLAIIANKPRTEKYLERLLKAQQENNTDLVDNCKEVLRSKEIKTDEITKLCQLQSEITNLELQLNQNLEQNKQKTQEITTIINHITNNYGANINGTVNISGGQTILGGHNQGITQTNNNSSLISGGDASDLNNNSLEQIIEETNNEQEMEAVIEKLVITKINQK